MVPVARQGALGVGAFGVLAMLADPGDMAVMLTDTALYRSPEYHSFRDLPEKVNAPEFARVAQGIIGTVRRLAGAP